MADAEKKTKRSETEEERKARKEKERAERKAKEKAEAAKSSETEEERKARKEKERAERKAKEKAEAAKSSETEEERKARKEKERAERKAKEKAEKKHHSSRDEDARRDSAAEDGDPSGGHHRSHKHETVDDPLLSALAEENRAAAREASKRHDDDSRDSRRKEEEVREKDAEARRAQRRAAREAQKAQKRKDRANGSEEDGANINEADSGTTGIDTRSLQRQGYRSQFEKDLARATMLRRLVDLDDVATVVMDAAPQSEYERYIRNFSSSGLQQVAVQCPPEENFISVDVQAERVKHKSRVAQVPDDLGLYPEQFAELNTFRVRGGAAAADADEDGTDAAHNTPASGENNTSRHNASGTGDGQPRSLIQPVDATALGTFLNRVFPVMNALLDENAGRAASPDNAKAKTSTTFSSASVSLTCSATLNRPVIAVRFGLASDQYLAVLYGGIDGPGPAKDLDRYTSVILLWNVFETSSPERALVSFARVTCVCPSPSRPHLIYAGTEDGCVCVWDLREPDRQHITTGRYQRLTYRLPSYTTSWQSDHHLAPVRQVCVAGYNALLGVRKEDHEQLASVDETGAVRFWIMNDSEKSRANAISESDHGQNMFASVRLYPATAKNSRLHGRDGGVAEEELAARPSSSAVGAAEAGLADYAADGSAWYACAADLDFAPADPSHYVVSMADGVHRVNRYGSIAAPALYGPSTHFSSTPTLVPTCVRYSGLDSRVLLVGYDDGTVRVYDDKASYPQLAVTLGNHRITQLCCSPNTKWMTWALDQASNLYLLDHARRNREVPVLSECVEKPDTGACLCMDIPREDQNERRRLALGFEKGMVQLHTLDPTKTLSATAERDVNWL